MHISWLLIHMIQQLYFVVHTIKMVLIIRVVLTKPNTTTHECAYTHAHMQTHMEWVNQKERKSWRLFSPLLLIFRLKYIHSQGGQKGIPSDNYTRTLNIYPVFKKTWWIWKLAREKIVTRNYNHMCLSYLILLPHIIFCFEINNHEGWANHVQLSRLIQLIPCILFVRVSPCIFSNKPIFKFQNRYQRDATSSWIYHELVKKKRFGEFWTLLI